MPDASACLRCGATPAPAGVCPRCALLPAPDSVLTHLPTRTPLLPDEDAPPHHRARPAADPVGRWLLAACRTWPRLLGVGLCLGFAIAPLCALAYDILYAWAVGEFSSAHRAAGLFAILLLTALAPPFAGLWVIAVRVLRAEPWTFATLFVPLGHPGFLASVAALTALAVGAYLSFFFTWDLFAHGRGGLTVLLVWLSIAFLLILPAGRLSFVLPLMLDRRMTLTQAVRESWRLTPRWVMRLLELHLVMAGLAWFRFVLCGVGLLLALPLIALAHAAAYLEITAASPHHQTTEAP